MLHPARYSKSAIALHWITFLLVLAAFAAIFGREYFERGSAMRDGLKWLHFSLGLTILGLTLARIAVRLTGPSAPPVLPPMPSWQAAAAKAVHLALYAFLIVQPLLGWLILSGEGASISLWGLPVPPLMAADKSAAEGLEDIHETLGKIAFLVIGAHAVLALVHHYVRGDNTLARMMPAPKVPPAA